MPFHVPILDACDDEQLFGFPLWPRQRELLASIEKGPRLHVWALGRRSGKSTLAAIVGLHSCLFRPDLDAKVRPGEARYAVAVATNQFQARVIVNAARSIIEHSPLLAEWLVRSTEDELGFANGTVFRAFPCSSRAGRGFPVSTLVFDEAAHFVDADGYQAAERVFQGLAPSVAQFGEEARIIVSSTPYGTAGFFADIYNQAAAGELPDARAEHAPTAQVNPTIDVTYLAREEARNPDSFRQEFLAEFLASGDVFLDFERIPAIADRGELPPSAAERWVAGLDPAFSNDPFGLAIVGHDPSTRGRLVLGYVSSFPPIKGAGAFDQRLAEVIEVVRRYGATCATDQYAAPAVLDRLRTAGISAKQVPMSAPSKTAIYSELRALLYEGRLELYEHPGLISELRRLKTHFTAGQAAVHNPRVGGSHGDMAQALALACYEAEPRIGLSAWTECSVCGKRNCPGDPFCDDSAVYETGGLVLRGAHYIDDPSPWDD